jgi:hypothetical protein
MGGALVLRSSRIAGNRDNDRSGMLSFFPGANLNQTAIIILPKAKQGRPTISALRTEKASAKRGTRDASS